MTGLLSVRVDGTMGSARTRDTVQACRLCEACSGAYMVGAVRPVLDRCVLCDHIT